MEGLWLESGVLSQLQGACRKGVSCVYSAYLLQESISTLLETHKKVFVTYLDMTKAFDGVWIGGLFYRLWELGIRGRIWRLLYNTYKDFQCRVRIQNQMSEWYPPPPPPPNPAGKCTYNVRTLYVQARTYGIGTDNIRNESFFDVRVRTYNVRT